MMANLSSSARSDKALKSILVAHLLVAVAFIAFGSLMVSRMNRLAESSGSMQTGDNKIQAAVASETDIERLRAMARRGWEQSRRDWQVISGLWKAFEEGFPGLVAISLSTVFMAWWGLSRGKAGESARQTE